VSKTARIVGIVVGAVALVVVLLFAGCSAVVNQINGGGGSASEKAAAMVAAADRVPENDWTLLNRYDPKVDNGCLSIDTPCLKLSASWVVEYAVDPEDVLSRMGLNMNPAGYSVFGPPCSSSESSDGTGKTDICINDSKDQPGSYQVDIFMTQR
jgi:uncharacterized protein YceK